MLVGKKTVNFDVKMAIQDRRGGIEYFSDVPPPPGKDLKRYLQWIKEHLVAVSYQAVKEEQAKGFDKNPITLVDGKKGRPLEFVNPLGKIEFISSKVEGSEIILEVYRQIMLKSPQVTGTYIKGNFILRNGKLIATNWSELKKWVKENSVAPKDQFQFINVLPYARRLERLGVRAGTEEGTIGRKKWVKSKDKRQRSGPMVLGANGTYFLAHRAAARANRGLAKISFGWISGAYFNMPIPTHGPNGKPFRRTFAVDKDSRGKAKKKSGPYIYPYIKVVIGEITK